MNFENIVLQDEGPIAVVKINRPSQRNALDTKTVSELGAALDVFRRSEANKVVIFTGEGDKAFVSGADINVLKDRTMFDALAMKTSGLFNSLERFDKPTIAAVNGYALGGGCELAMACDIRVASETAKFGLPELGLGILPGAGGTQRLPRIVGLGRAKQIILTGEMIDAQKALEYGLVSEVVPPDQLMRCAREWADRILSRGPLATRLAKLAINMSVQVGQDAGLVIEALAQAVAFESEDKLEGTSAFLEKRKPKFKGR